ncbi:DeoR/GlpR family DNA-binding transcription regulator [Gracilimonas mengyeensis]|uniref:Transcriptional regulator, DeoR family n=1 Tax=Gracilimonas mengyeensis TaxID=1302730 RepID=A0A521EII6_9BACT|nr:DeoR/GlpR family DNA-binding transcription regulator [Gracilimonas mengyeensis]SMO83672.1 transcriptional regulator, DeoR family [Gracilimonas mengyeensis]
MTVAERHETILKKLKESGKVYVQELSEDLDVSEVTIRKDLRVLEEKGLLFRTHGGATQSNPYTSDRPVSEKEKVQAEEKSLIAQEALKLIGDNDSIVLASGTTILALARKIHPNRRLNVITSALNISLELAQHKNVEILQLGGQLRQSSTSVVGPYAEQFLDGITCGILFLGVDGIDLDHGLTTSNLMEASLNQRFIEVAQYTVVLADHTKFGKRGFSRICSLDKVQHIITDEGVSAETVAKLEESGVQVTIAR